MAIVPDKGIPLWKALLRKRILSDGMVYCPPSPRWARFQGIPQDVMIQDTLCPETGGWVRTKKVFDVEAFCSLIYQGLRCFTVAPRQSGWNDLCYHCQRGRRFGVPFQSICRTCSHRIKFCIQWGLGYSP